MYAAAQIKAQADESPDRSLIERRKSHRCENHPTCKR